MPDTILNVKFDGEASGVISEADRAAGSVKRFGDATERQTGRSAAGAKKVARAFGDIGLAAAKAGAAVAATAGVAFAALVKQGLEAGDALAKTSDKLGVTTEALASMRLAANQTGVATRQFDMALQRVTRRIAEAAAGTGEAKNALKVLGLEASSLVRLKPDQVLGAIADQFNRIENPAQRVQVAFKLFDAEGVGLINTLRLGSAGLDDFRKKAETLGLAVSRETVSNIERANDAIDLLKQGLTGLATQLAARSAPFLEALATQMFAAVEEMGGMEKAAQRLMGVMVESIARIANVLHAIYTPIVGLRAAFNEIFRAVMNILRMIDVAMTYLMNKVIDTVNLIITLPIEALRTITDAISFIIRDISENEFLPDFVTEQAAKFANSLDAASSSLGDISEAAKFSERKISQFLRTATLDAQALSKELADEFYELLQNPPPGDQLRKWFEEVSKNAAIMAKETIDETKKIDEQADISASSVSKSFATAAKVSTTAWQDFGAELRDIFVDVFKSGGDALDNFVDRVKVSFKEAGLRQLFDGTVGRAFAGGAGGISAFAQSIGGGSVTAEQSLLSQVGAAGGALSLLQSGAIGGLTAFGGTVLGGIDAGAKIIAQIFGEGAVSNIASSAYSNLFNNTMAAGEIVGLSGDAAFGAGSLMSAGASIAGSFAGNKIGSAIFNKQAESNIGSIVGSVLGSFGGPIGSLIGSTIGSLLDVAFGGDGKTRSNTGALVGSDARTGSRFGDFVTGASGLTFQSYTRRGDRAAADSFTEALLLLDATLTQTARAAGVDVNLAGRDQLGVITDAGHSGSGSFFGAKGFNGAGTLEGEAEAFVSAWLNEVNEQLPLRVQALNAGIADTAEEMVVAFQAGVRLDQLTSVSVFDEVQKLFDVLEDLAEPSETMFEIYTRLTEQTFSLNDAYDGSAMSMADLANSLTEQKTIAYQLVTAYRAVSIEIDQLLGNTIQNIRESVLTDEQVYAARRQEIAALTSELETAVTPERINEIVAEIDALTNQAYSLLDDSQQQALANEFIAFLTNVQSEAQGRIDAGLASIEQTEADLNVAIDASVFQDAVARFGDAVDRFNGDGGNGQAQIIRIEIPGQAPIEFDPRDIPEVLPEVSIAGF